MKMPAAIAQKLIECAGKNLMRVQFERDQTRNDASAEDAENPGAHRHGRSMFENAQHVEEEMRTAEIHDQQNWRKDRAGDGRDPHGGARKIDMMKENGAARDHGDIPAMPAEEKVERNFPGPDRRFHDRLAVVAGFARNRPAGNIDAFARNDAVLPRLSRAVLRVVFVRRCANSRLVMRKMRTPRASR